MGGKVNKARGKDVISLLLEPLETKGMNHNQEAGIPMVRT